MKLIIDIPEKEFGIEIEDKFQDFFTRLEVETKEHMISGTNLLCGAYELETIQMLMQALAKGTLLPKGHGNLKDIDKIEQILDVENPDNIIAKALKNLLESVPTIIEADKAESEET